MKVGHTLHKNTSLFTKLHLSLVKASSNVATKSFLLSYIYIIFRVWLSFLRKFPSIDNGRDCP